MGLFGFIEVELVDWNGCEMRPGWSGDLEEIVELVDILRSGFELKVNGIATGCFGDKNGCSVLGKVKATEHW